jgi:hypothetical protein
MWATKALSSNVVAVWPVGDSVKHIIESDDCGCDPEMRLHIEFLIKGYMLVHRARDGRPQ